jgi:hypothetical protein
MQTLEFLGQWLARIWQRTLPFALPGSDVRSIAAFTRRRRKASPYADIRD